MFPSRDVPPPPATGSGGDYAPSTLWSARLEGTLVKTAPDSSLQKLKQASFFFKSLRI